jgi:hypothetical protein
MVDPHALSAQIAILSGFGSIRALKSTTRSRWLIDEPVDRLNSTTWS